jgi:hypothetical protein
MAWLAQLDLGHVSGLDMSWLDDPLEGRAQLEQQGQGLQGLQGQLVEQLDGQAALLDDPLDDPHLESLLLPLQTLPSQGPGLALLPIGFTAQPHDAYPAAEATHPLPTGPCTSIDEVTAQWQPGASLQPQPQQRSPQLAALDRQAAAASAPPTDHPLPFQGLWLALLPIGFIAPSGSMYVPGYAARALMAAGYHVDGGILPPSAANQYRQLIIYFYYYFIIIVVH